MSHAWTNPGNATSPIGNRLAGAVGRFFRFEEAGASPRGEGRKVHVLVHVIAVCIVLGYAALKIVSWLGSKGAVPQ